MNDGRGTCPDCKVTFEALPDTDGRLTCPICGMRFPPAAQGQAASLGGGAAALAQRRRQLRAGVMGLGVILVVLGGFAAGHWLRANRATPGTEPLKNQFAGNLRAPAVVEQPSAKHARPPLSATDVTLPLAVRVNEAIDRGVLYLRQTFDEVPHPCPYLALLGLTLLETGAPVNDPIVDRIAKVLRKEQLAIMSTYELSLAILFFDFLGQADDSRLIQTLGERLCRGQLAEGTWSYACLDQSPGKAAQAQSKPGELKPQAMDMLPFLRTINYGIVVNSKKGGPDKVPQDPGSGDALADIARKLQTPWPQQGAFPDIVPPKGNLGPMLWVYPQVRGDHSNTQFAVLALWVAARHGSSVRDALRKAETHFLQHQYPDGSWGYSAGVLLSRDSMTCGALMTLGLGLGLDLKLGAADQAFAGKKRTLSRGFAFLDKALTRAPRPAGKRFLGAEASSDLYFLWSLDRLAMAFNITTIGKTSWYPWAAELIVAAQCSDGSWSERFVEHIDTCFALLVLRRSNPAGDLANLLDTAPDRRLLPTFIEAGRSGPGNAPQDRRLGSVPGKEAPAGKLSLDVERQPIK